MDVNSGERIKSFKSTEAVFEASRWSRYTSIYWQN